MRQLLFIIALLLSIQLNGQEVYLTKTGKKYHKSTCRYLKYSKRKVTLEEVKQFGYRPCLVCKPGTKIIAKEKRVGIPKDDATVPMPSVAIQCTGKTKSGRRCKRKTKNANGKCYQH